MATPRGSHKDGTRVRLLRTGEYAQVIRRAGGRGTQPGRQNYYVELEQPRRSERYPTATPITHVWVWHNEVEKV
jgi:hypothetical protein